LPSDNRVIRPQGRRNMYTVRMVLLVSVFFSFLFVDTSRAQDISLLPTGLTFSNQVVGSSSGIQEITLTNTDEVHALTITTIVASGDFTQTNTCGSSVAAGKACTISVQFAPASVGAIDGSISVFDNAPASPQLVGLSGTGLAQETVSPSSLNFGTVTIGKTSAIKTIKLTNNTASSIAISSIAASGDFSAVPATSGGCGSSLGANASCTEDVFFTPTELGTVDGSVIFADASSQQYVTLTAKGSGTADSPITLTPSTLAFGNQTIDSTSVAQSVTIKNTGASSLGLTFAASGSYIKSNPASGACGSSLAGGASCTINVQFSPAVLGAIDGGVSVSYSGSNSPQVAGLTGTGVGQVTISPTSIAFPPQQVDTTSGAHKVTVTNNSSSAISVDSIVPSTDFKETNTCGGSIAVGSNCVISVSFAPTQGGLLSGSLIIDDSATNSPQIVDLSGNSHLVTRFAYVSNSAESIETASIYAVNLKTGQLRSNGYELAGVVQAVDPSGRFAYALGATGNTISAYTINATSGQLNQVTGSPWATGDIPQSITVDPSGKFVYVANQTSNNISAYTINGDTGALTAVTGSPFPSGDDPGSVVIDPTGRFAYVNNLNDSPGGDVSGYTISPTTGALTAMAGSPFLSRTGALAVAIAPSGEFGYVLQSPGEVTTFSINATTGVPTVVGSLFSTGAASSFSLVMAPSGEYMYIPGGNNPGTISAVKINTTTGGLTLVTGSPFAAGYEPTSATVDPNGALLYVTNTNIGGTSEPNSNEVWTYTITGDGALTLLNKARTQQGPGRVVLAGGSAAVTYTPKFAYVANSGSNNVSAYSINASSGHLTAASGSPFAAGMYPNWVVVDPSGRFAYVANSGSNSVSEYTINSASGALAAISGSPLATSSPVFVAVDPSGRFAYVGNNSSITGYTINASTGALTAISGSSVSITEVPTGGAVDPTGQFLYVVAPPSSGNGGYVYECSINPSTGALATITGSPFTADMNYPISIAVDSSGRFAYVTNLVTVNSNFYMSSFAIDSTLGALTFLNFTPPLGAGTYAAATDPLGQFVYATQNAVSDLVALSFDSATDTFTLLNSDVCVPQSTPVSITVDASGKFVYVANAGSTANNITACAIDQTTGDLSNITGQSEVAAGMGPLSITTTGSIH
jgi:6-phosphogluconolactonase (cycloisomerase 2 family)